MLPRDIHLVPVLCISILLTLSACEREPSTSRSVAVGGASLSTKGASTAQQFFQDGVRLGKGGDYRAAVQAYTRAIELNRKYTDAYVYRALTHLQLGNFVAAISDLNAVVDLDPSADSYRTRADVYARNGRIDQAIADYDKSIALNPNDASAYRNRGTAYSERGDYPKALGDITKAIQLEPAAPRWRFDRAMLKARQGKYDDAMVDAQEALRLAGGVPDLRPGEARVVDELAFNCMRLVADLEKAGARRAP